ncbi:uncharacterized protein PHALS_15301 [Plasmopara halstedii]|uniref:RxLR-like protein n=1 Tax=Plasmopara halstedii TaxID=4781 RepID=A0A0P1ACM8_PLAHL|nr:uncharacterized protein PHALS_15301 [Plasmopara halstedii]CEG38284.1 hypothetical protein PHALS_15301 [Plasmopara halstedii]|eukprot:XP_024574653.1 hypothetical protein PHALS_15301 [Plasmopara halstedii]
MYSCCKARRLARMIDTLALCGIVEAAKSVYDIDSIHRKQKLWCPSHRRCQLAFRQQYTSCSKWLPLDSSRLRIAE